MEAIISVVLHLICIWIVFSIGASFVMWTIKKYGIEAISFALEDNQETSDEEQEEGSEPVQMTIEIKKMEDVLYVYHENNFLYQANTSDEVHDFLVKKFPKARFFADEESLIHLYGTINYDAI